MKNSESELNVFIELDREQLMRRGWAPIWVSKSFALCIPSGGLHLSIWVLQWLPKTAR